MEREWKNVKIIQDFFQIQEDGSMPEGSRILLAVTRLVTFQKGQELVTIGTGPDDGVYIILDSTTQIFLVGDEPVGEQGPGKVIGELVPIKEGTRRTTVRAMTEVSCASIPKKVFEEIAHSNPKVYGALLEPLCTESTDVVREWECMKFELEIVLRIQMGMLPKSFEQHYRLLNISLDTRTKPAKMVGDNFYDIFQIDETYLYFLIADVAGEGLPACLFMTVVRTYIKNYMRLGMSVAEAAKRVNSLPSEDNEEELFATVFLCVLDLQKNRPTFANAGHNRPAISRGHGPFQLLKCNADFVFGMMEDMMYQEQITEFRPGDSLYLYTDGVTEAFNTDEELYTEAKMLEALSRYREAREQPGLMLDHMYRELEELSRGAEQSGDVTMMYLVR